MKLREAISPDGGRYDDAGDYWFKSPAEEFALAHNAICTSPRVSLAVIRVAGSEAEAFLQGQLITNLRKLDPERGSLSAWCTPQGRVSFLFHLIPEVNGYLLLVPESEAARLVQRLKMFVLRAKVTVEDVSTQCAVIGLSVPRACARPPWVDALHAARNVISGVTDELRALCIDDFARFLVWGDTRPLLAWWRDCALPSMGDAAWRLLDIEQGYAEITGDAVNAFLPQQLNLDMLDALAFDKGCYPGQEIIARLKYRGEVKSRLLRGHAHGEVPRGARLRTLGAAQSAGQILSAVTLPSAETELLAVVELSALMVAPQVEGAPLTQLQFEPPPYWNA